MRKFIAIATFMTLPMMAIADPAPFGLEIGKASIKDVKAKYGAQKTGINKYSGGEMYDLEVSRIKFDGLQKASVIFSREGKLLAVLTTLPKHKFDYVLNGLSNKYQLVSKKIPFVGNKSAKLIDGNTEITLDAPHMGFKMDMNYINKDLWKLYKSQSNSENKKKKQSEQSQL